MRLATGMLSDENIHRFYFKLSRSILIYLMKPRNEKVSRENLAAASD